MESRVVKVLSKWRDFTGVIYDNKTFPMKVKILTPNCMVAKHGQCQQKMKGDWQQYISTKMARWPMGVSLLEYQRDENILDGGSKCHEEKLQWFGHVKRRDETDNTRAVAEKTKAENGLEEDSG